MESVIIVTPGPYDAELRSRLARSWTLPPAAGNGWVIEDGASRIYVRREELDGMSFAPEERARIEAAIPDPVCYVVDWRDVSLCRRVLFAIADDPKILVDNDHGTRLSGTEFIERMRRQPAWDWRNDPVIWET